MWGLSRRCISQVLTRSSPTSLIQNRCLLSSVSPMGQSSILNNNIVSNQLQPRTSIQNQSRSFSQKYLEGVPVISGNGILAGGEPSEQLVQQVRDACQDWGFFVLVDHGLQQQQTDHFFQIMKQFFELPLEDKLYCKRTEDNARGFFNDEFTKQTLDLKEGFDFGSKPYPELSDEDPLNRDLDGVNRWLNPGHPMAATFKDTMWNEYLTLEQASFRLTRVLSLGLGLHADFFEPFFKQNSSFLRLNYYPQYTQEGQIDPNNPPLGVNPHKDAGFLTLLFHDGVQGLQVDRDDDWYYVPNVPNSVVVNVGDMCQIWSNDRYVAAQHRVISQTSNRRFSAPFFFNPNYATEVYPIAPNANYSSCNWGYFRAQRFAGDYADQGKPEIQISDFAN